MKTKMLSERKRKEARKSFLCSKFMNFIWISTFLSLFVFSNMCFAGDGSDAITTAQNLLSKAATAGGGLWAVWGLVQLGMSIKDHNGPGIGGAVWQIVGGAVIIAAGTAVGSLNLSMAAT